MYFFCSMLLQILLRILYNIKGIYLITFPEVQHILHAKSYLVLRISTEIVALYFKFVSQNKCSEWLMFTEIFQ